MAIQKSDRAVARSILNDDKVVAQFAENCDRLFAGKTARVSAKSAATVQKFLNQQLCGHFAYEERHILPELLRAGRGAEVARTVAEIQQDHRALIQEIHELTRLLAAENSGGPERQALRVAMAAFRKHLQQHSALENTLYPSLV